VLAALAAAYGAMAHAQNLPDGYKVTGGNATVSNPAGNKLQVNQTTNNAIIAVARVFRIGANYYVQFVQPSSGSIALNRVVSGAPSEILGNLSANGQVFLVTRTACSSALDPRSMSQVWSPPR